MKQSSLIPAAIVLSISTFLMFGCSSSEQTTQNQATESAAANVSVYTVQAQSINLVENLPARVQAFRVAQIRPQVGGIIEQVLFKQGSEVNAGQSLFKINSAIFQANVNSNKASLNKAKAEVVRLKLQLDRYQQLLPSNAISKQEYNNVQAQHRQAIADVEQLKATLTRQNLNLQYATVRAPISGKIGSILVTEGALVSQGDSNAMAVIQQIDKVYVDVKQSISEFEQLQNDIENGTLTANQQGAVEILNSQGQPYPVTGKILFSDSNVDPETGDVTIRIEVNNPDRKLLPGMYVRASINRASIANALLVPEQAIQRDPSGKAQVVVINKQSIGEIRPVELGQQHEGFYVVTQGLKGGEQIVVEGLDRVTPEQKLNVKRWKGNITSDNSQQKNDTQKANGHLNTALDDAKSDNLTQNTAPTQEPKS